MRKLTKAHLERLRPLLRRRHELLCALRPFSMKALAAEFGVHPQTIYRLSEECNGVHLPDPIQCETIDVTPQHPQR